MKKIKFTIKGMDCQSCAGLLEEKLTEQAGVISASVNPQSGKAALIFEESKITSEEIIKTVKNSGDYQVVDLEVKEENLPQTPTIYHEQKISSSGRNMQKIYFIMGFLTSISILSIILNFWFAFSLNNIKS